jgi:hypothetical protein
MDESSGAPRAPGKPAAMAQGGAPREGREKKKEVKR